MKIENNKLVFDSGREFVVNMHIIGLRVDGDDPKLFDESAVFGGYDESFKTPEMFYDAECATDSDALSHAECVELADFMVAQWAAFRERHANTTPAADIVHGAGALSVDDFASLGNVGW